jgi:hypothetical protein
LICLVTAGSLLVSFFRLSTLPPCCRDQPTCDASARRMLKLEDLPDVTPDSAIGIDFLSLDIEGLPPPRTAARFMHSLVGTLCFGPSYGVFPLLLLLLFSQPFSSRLPGRLVQLSLPRGRSGTIRSSSSRLNHLLSIQRKNSGQLPSVPVSRLSSDLVRSSRSLRTR